MKEEVILRELAKIQIGDIVLAYNLVRLAMLETARRQDVAVDRISFVDALRWLLSGRLGNGLPRLVVNPSRPGRVEPRVRKRRPKEYPVMKRPRAEMRKALLHKTVPA